MRTKKTKSKKKNKFPSQEWSQVKGAKRHRLISERKKRKLTQAQLAMQMGVSTAYISSLENGRVAPGIELAINLQAFFDLPYEVLFPDL
ncbi:MAG: helix-turn-helix transcriptional regulator [Bacillota bacterium]